MSAHLSRLRLFQRHLRSLVWVWVWVWDSLAHFSSHALPFFSPPSFTHYPFPPRSLVCGGQPSPHKPRLVVSRSACPPLSSSPHVHSFVLGTAVINNNTVTKKKYIRLRKTSRISRQTVREAQSFEDDERQCASPVMQMMNGLPTSSRHGILCENGGQGPAEMPGAE
jgi:hypothetical protein